MKKLKIILILLSLSLAGYSQDFDLNTYKYRYQKYQGLQFNFDLGSRGEESFNNDFDSLRDQRDFFNRGFNQSNFSFAPGYFAFENSDRIQRTTTLSLNNRTNFSRDKMVGSSAVDRKSISSNNNLNLDLNNSVRFYKGNSFTYFAQGLEAAWSENQTSTRSIPEDSRKSTISRTVLNVNTTLSFGFGEGRLEFVTDAVQSMFLLADLERLTGETYSNSQIEEIAKGITQIRNARYLDFRLGYMKQIKLLDEVLKQNGIVGKDATDFFIAITDNWLYARNLNRSSGERWTHALNIGNSHLYDKSNRAMLKPISLIDEYTHNHFSGQFYAVSFSSQYDNSTQISLKTQRSFGAEVNAGAGYNDEFEKGIYSLVPINTEIVPKDKYRFANAFTTLSAYWQHLHQPNTRNYFILRVSPQVNYTHILPKYLSSSFSYSTLNEFDFSLRSTADVYHWFSPNLNAFASVTLDLGSDHSRTGFLFNRIEENDFIINYRFNAGIAYQLF